MTTMTTKSTHRAEVVPITLEKHPNADTLSIVNIWGFTVVVKTSDWEDKNKGIYIVPDSVVDTTRPEFSFLGDSPRIKVRKFRGIVSQGLLIPAPEESVIGHDYAEYYGIKRYEPPEEASTGGEAVKAPSIYAPVYDLENLQRYLHCFEKGEPVYVTEKIHGTSARFVYHDNQLFVGSRKEWKKDTPESVYWKVVRQYPGIEEFCRKYPDTIVYGEVYGWVQDLRYGHGIGKVSFAAFDILRPNGQWMNFYAAKTMTAKQFPWVPLLISDAHFDYEELKKISNGNSLVDKAGCIREGIVVFPTEERNHSEIGRVKLKLVSDLYLSR